MRRWRNAVLVELLVLGMTGCANPLHYGWAYVPLRNPHADMFRVPKGNIEYRQLKGPEEMAAAEGQMYQKGYVMVGYSNFFSPQVDFMAPANARRWGEDIGASAVLQTINGNHFLATFWAKPKTFVLGAYYSGNLSEGAHAALEKAFHFSGGVVVQSVVQGSPAFKAGLLPGDLLISMNGELIKSAETLDKMLRADAGSRATFVDWAMTKGKPQLVKVALNPLWK